MKKSTKFLIIFMIILIALTPFGSLSSGSAWGEWEPEKFKEIAGFIPKSIQYTKPIVEAMIPDYQIKGIGSTASAITSATIGALLTLAVLFGLKQMTKRER